MAKHTAEDEALAGIAARLVRGSRELERQTEAMAQVLLRKAAGATWTVALVAAFIGGMVAGLVVAALVR